MAHPFLKSIRPVNLLSFGPDTPEIELRPLNILIGPNGSGKSNLIEILGLLKSLTEKKPWTYVTKTGGRLEWVWKNPKQESSPVDPARSSLDVVSTIYPNEEIDYLYQIELRSYDFASTFSVDREAISPYPPTPGDIEPQSELWRDSDVVRFPQMKGDSIGTIPPSVKVTDQVSVLSQPLGLFGANSLIPYIFQRISLYRECTIGAGSKARSLERAGSESTLLDEDNSNLAHVLNFILTHQNREPGEKLRKAFQAFSNDAKDIETRIQEGFVQLRVRESSGISTPASRLSDGTLRWLALLAILLNPDPPPVTCIEEPELGLHPDILPILADLLVDASTRTQLVITTHSRSFLDSFTDTPEAVCVCEKIEGSTVIRRLDKDELRVWLDEYALGKLWTSGEIGGNRW